MIGVIAKLDVKPDMDAAFREHAAALIKKVNANEDGCMLYELFKAKEGNSYVFMEKYVDQEALAAHGQTEYFKAAQPLLGACLAAAPDVQIYDAI
jgi:quinol monooxygenase YgiN